MQLTYNQLLDQCRELAVSGEFAEIEPLADAMLATDPAVETGWILKAVAMIGTGRIDAGLALVDNASDESLTDTLIAVMAGRFLLDAGAFQHLSAISKIESADCANRAIWLYFAGCGLMMTGAETLAFECFDSFNDAVRPLVARHGVALFIENQSLNLVLRQGRLVAGPDEVEARIRRFAQKPVRPDLDIIHSPIGEGLLFVSCCNGEYFDAFGDLFTHRLMAWREDVQLHLQVSQPGTTSEARLLALADTYPGRLGYGVTRNPPHATAAYFTCERFFVAEHLLRTLGRAVMTLDLDVTPRAAAPDFHTFADSADFACFETGRNEPASVLQASAMIWNPGAASLSHLSAVQAYCLGGDDIENPSFVSWMIDQAALFSVRHFFNVRRPGQVRFADLRDAGVTLEQAFETIGEEEQKQALKNRVYAGEKTEIRL